MTQPLESMLGFLAKLVDVDSLQQGLVEMALGVALNLDAGHSTQAFLFYRYHANQAAASVKSIKNVDLRVPTDPARLGQEFLYLELLPTAELTAGMIIGRFGQPQNILPSTPQQQQATGAAVTYVYALGKRQVSFVFNAAAEPALMAIALEKRP